MQLFSDWYFRIRIRKLHRRAARHVVRRPLISVDQSSPLNLGPWRIKGVWMVNREDDLDEPAVVGLPPALELTGRRTLKNCHRADNAWPTGDRRELELPISFKLKMW